MHRESTVNTKPDLIRFSGSRLVGVLVGLRKLQIAAPLVPAEGGSKTAFQQLFLRSLPRARSLCRGRHLRGGGLVAQAAQSQALRKP